MNLINQKTIEEIKTLRPLFFRDAFPKIFSWQELYWLLNLRPFLNPSRFKTIGKSHDSKKVFNWPHQVWITDQSSIPASYIKNMIDTHTCYITDASRVNEKINKICDELENALNGFCDAHIYFNVSSDLDSGIGIHWDHSHNLIVQVEGESEICIWDGIIDGSQTDLTSKNKTENEVPMIKDIMRTGDAVFVPMRHHHKIVSKTKRLSVSFPLILEKNSVIKQKQDRTWINI